MALSKSTIADVYWNVFRQPVGQFYLRTVRPRIKELTSSVRYSLKDPTRVEGSISTNGRDVLVITVDCLRADHLSTFGYERETTPFLDEFGTRFSNAITTAPWTFPSISSILTGYYPYQHGARYDTDFRNPKEQFPPMGIAEDVPSIFDILDAADYNSRLTTAVYMGGIPFQARVPSLKLPNNANARDVFNSFETWWKNSGDKPRFGYLHLADLHIPLADPKMRPFGPIDFGLEDLTDWSFRSSVKPANEFKEYRENRIKLYDTLLRYVDRELEQFFERLGDDLDDTIVFVLGDHGEAFWDHHAIERELFEHPYDDYGIDHGHSMFQELLNVPIIVKNAHLEPGQRDDYVSTVDIIPTILNELDVSWAPDEQYPGRSLSQQADRPHPIFAEETAYGYQQRAVVKDGYKYIQSNSAGVSLLYNLESDPNERTDRSEHPEMQDTLQRLREAIPTGGVVGEASVVDADAREHLSDLGYL